MGGRRNASFVDKQAKFVRQVSDLLNKLDERKEEMSEKLSERVNKLREKVEEQQNTVVPKLQETLDKLDEQREDMKAKTTPLVRKAVTGDEELAVADWLNKYKVVKAIDKVTFVGGVMFMQLTQYALLRFPDYFRFYFTLSAFVLLGLRYYTYKRDGMHYFLLDYCYLTNLLCLLNAIVLPRNANLWQVNFVATNGPLMWAIVAWRNSLVFHSLDKVVSIFIHVVPALLTYAERWLVTSSPMCHGSSCSMDVKTAFALPMLVFLFWQISYLVITELLRKHRFQEDPSLMTSLRWIAKDKKNMVHQLILRFGRETGQLAKDEELDISTKPALIITTFVMFQTVYTLATFIPTWILFKSQVLHTLFIVVICMMACYNGANFYFEVFAKRYEAGLQKARSKEKRKSKRESKRNSHKPPKGFCAMPNEAERALLEDERKARQEQPEEEPALERTPTL